MDASYKNSWPLSSGLEGLSVLPKLANKVPLQPASSPIMDRYTANTAYQIQEYRRYEEGYNAVDDLELLWAIKTVSFSLCFSKSRPTQIKANWLFDECRLNDNPGNNNREDIGAKVDSRTR